jgi:hypothetical protein
MKDKHVDNMVENAEDCHKVWHRFYGWLMKTYGKDLYTDGKPIKYKDDKGKEKEFKFKHFNEFELSRRLGGTEVIDKVEKYVKKYCPEIKIVRCDDSYYAGSIILLIPHPHHGITMMFIPQCSGIQNQMFLYDGHFKMLMKELNEMKSVYKNSIG